MPLQTDILTFAVLLKHYGIFQPEEVYKIVCPFHADKNASMQVNIPRAFFYCYAQCGAQGGSVELHKLYQEKYFKRKINDFKAIWEIKQIVKKYLQSAGVSMHGGSEEGGREGKGEGRRERGDYRGVREKGYGIGWDGGWSEGGKPLPSLTDITSITNLAYNLPSSSTDITGLTSITDIPFLLGLNKDNAMLNKKLSYKEGITQARSFYFNLPNACWFKPSKIPCVEEETRECRKYMKQRGFSNLLLKRAGIKPSLNKNYPLVIPLWENGLFRGYVMRTFDPEIEAQRKYLYNAGFKREKTLPGEYGKKQGSDTVVLVEGYLDKLKANQLGIKNVAALLGWKISETQIKKLQKAGIKKIICATDNDKAGKQGYEYLKRIAKLYNFTVERVRYPKGIKDMGDLIPDTKAANRVLKQIKRFGGT